jgi:hypothetical protein
VFSIWFLHTDEILVQLELLQSTASEKKASCIGSSPIGKTMLDSVSLEFMGVRSYEDLVATNLRSDDLGDDVFVGEASKVLEKAQVNKS